MTILDFFKRKPRAKTKVELFSSELSCVRCLATDCYFNNIYRGECECDLKIVDINMNGKCRNFKERREAAGFFEQADNSAEQEKENEKRD